MSSQDSAITHYAVVINESSISVPFLMEFVPFLNLNGITILSMLPKCPLESLTVMEFALKAGEVAPDQIKGDLLQLCARTKTDVALQTASAYRTKKRLVIFDMDSTLIQQEVIDEIAKHAGVVDRVAAITESAMNGEIDFKESLRRRVGLLKGTSSEVFELVKKQITFTDGALDLCRALKKMGMKLAVISGGFTPLARYVQAELGLDFAHANELGLSADGKTLDGTTVGTIVDGPRKAELLLAISQAENVRKEEVIAVGDGANDLWMLSASGLGVAFNAKPRVQEQVLLQYA
ncbi:hypothetical protein HK101_004009 [Irineochytrium annulatum]|nr:hypothetical protein HK101_004009 [Irineochytrium annulatum]